MPEYGYSFSPNYRIYLTLTLLYDMLSEKQLTDEDQGLKSHHILQ